MACSCLFSFSVHNRTAGTFYCFSLPPSRSLSCWIRLGKSLQRPSTSCSVLTCAQHCRSRAAKAWGVSSQHSACNVISRRRRSQETAVSCSSSSCKCPGCTQASSPPKNIEARVGQRSLELHGDLARPRVVEAFAPVDEHHLPGEKSINITDFQVLRFLFSIVFEMFFVFSSLSNSCWSKLM